MGKEAYQYVKSLRIFGLYMGHDCHTCVEEGIGELFTLSQGALDLPTEECKSQCATFCLSSPKMVIFRTGVPYDFEVVDIRKEVSHGLVW